MKAFMTMTKDGESARRTKRFFMKRGIPCEMEKRRDGRYALFTHVSYSHVVRHLRPRTSA